MGIYIKHMEKPTNCVQCELCDDESRFCKAAKRYIPDFLSASFCPIESVPPHGRLIDADTLLPHMFVGPVGTDEHYIYRVGWNDAFKVISANAPTIIAADEGENDNAKED